VSAQIPLFKPLLGILICLILLIAPTRFCVCKFAGGEGLRNGVVVVRKALAKWLTSMGENEVG
jgi:hypothetical protein